MSEPVGDEEGLVLGEVAVVEDQQELAALLQPLDRVRDARWEVPQVSLANVVDEVAPLRGPRIDAPRSPRIGWGRPSSGPASGCHAVCDIKVTPFSLLVLRLPSTTDWPST